MSTSRMMAELLRAFRRRMTAAQRKWRRLQLTIHSATPAATFLAISYGIEQFIKGGPPDLDFFCAG
jgi:hypothetical protein